MTNSKIRYLLLTTVFCFLSSGAVIAAFMDSYKDIGYNILWMILPMTVLFMSAVIVNDFVLVPRLLLKKRYGWYCSSVLGVAYAVSILGLVTEYGTRSIQGLPMRISNYASLWILADSLSNCTLLFLIMLSLGIFQLYKKMDIEVKAESEIMKQLDKYMETVNDRLNPDYIIEKLDSVAVALRNTPEVAEVKIRELCAYLRVQLYELPKPPAISPSATISIDHTRLSYFLVDKQFQIWRNILLLMALAIVSFGTFFYAPDKPEFTEDNLVSALFLFFILTFLAYINILWLYPRFKVRGNIRKYVWSVVIFILLLTLPLIIVQILTYEPNVYTNQLPLTLSVISTIGSLLTLLLFVGGTSAMLLLQDWIRTQQRMVLLHAETARQEYEYLRKQINPHFLFNILNNIGIIAYDEPAFSLSLLEDLKSLLIFQFKDMKRDFTTISDELNFLRSYLTLEQSRRDKFTFLIDCAGCNADLKMPTLLFIPFVENAVKYSPRAESNVEVVFRQIDDRLIFECANTFAPDEISNQKYGGIGLVNTRRRLDLLYGNNYRLRCDKNRNDYKVDLEIPLV